MTLYEVLTQNWWPVAMLKLLAVPFALTIGGWIVGAILANPPGAQDGGDVGKQLGGIGEELAELNDRLRIQFPDAHERDSLRRGIDPYNEQ
jgi:hypothetical protein